MHKDSAGTIIFRFLNVLLMLIIIICMLYPMIHIALASVSNPSALMAHEGIILKPIGGFSWAAYQLVFKDPLVIGGYLNTLFVVIVSLPINILLTSMGGYVLSRKNVFWKRHIMFFIIFTMFFSGGLIPFYLTVAADLNLKNTLWSLIIPTAVNTFNLIIMRTAFEAIPLSLEESAKLDGAGHWRILFRIVLPLSMPVVAVMILYYAVEKWNGWFHAAIFINERTLYPLQLILREKLIQNDTNSMTSGVMLGDQIPISDTVKYAVIIVATAPILTIYPFLQRYFVKGVMIGAIKG